MELDFRKFRSYRQINMKQKLFKNLVVSQKTLIFAGVIEIKIKNYGKNH